MVTDSAVATKGEYSICSIGRFFSRSLYFEVREKCATPRVGSSDLGRESQRIPQANLQLRADGELLSVLVLEA